MQERKKRIKSIVSSNEGFRLRSNLYESFVLYNPQTGKNQRFAVDPKTPDLDKAKAVRRNVEIKLGIAKIRAQKRFDFLQKFNDQAKLFEAYTKHRQKVSKKSWQEDVSRMNGYVFPFFIGQMNLNHPSHWYEYWQEFQDFIKYSKRKNTKTPGKLAVNSKDNIIRAANSFIAFVELKESGSPMKRLPEFKYEEKGQRGVESVYSAAEISNVHKKFIERKELTYAHLWLLIANTGMRVGEAISLMAEDVVFNAVPSQEKWIFTALKDKVEMFGYILLKSQAADINHLVSNGDVKRAPLKKRKKIAPEYNRVIPLIDIETAKVLKELKKKVSQHNLLFEGCSYRTFYKLFVEIKTELKLNVHRDIHSLRHSFATKLVKLCDGDPRIVEKILGHSDPKMTVRYNHLANEMEANVLSDDDSELKPLKF